MKADSKFGLFITLGIVLLSSSVGHAGSFWVSVNAGQNSYGLEESPGMDIQSDRSGSWLELKPGHVEKGHSIGGAVGYEKGHSWSMQLGYSRLHASSPIEYSRPAEMDFSAHVWELGLTKHLVELSIFDFGLRAGIGLGQLAGFIYFSERENPWYSGSVTGNTIQYSAGLSGRAEVVRGLKLEGFIGLREMEFGKVKGEWFNIVSRATGDSQAFDYGGMFLQIGLNWTWPQGL